MIEIWASYALSDFLMFSPASYFRRYELANADLWPAHLLMAGVAGALLWLMRRGQLHSDPWIAMLLAASLGQAIGWIPAVIGVVTFLGSILAHGQLIPIASDPTLFSILGTKYGGDGISTFALPDLRGRFPMHPGTGAGLTTRHSRSSNAGG